MKLGLVVTRDELAALAAELVPVRIVLREHPYGAVSFGRALELELVENQGIRVRGDARIALSVAGLTMQVGVRAWQILLRPSVAGAVPALAFDPVLEHLDLERVPGFLDGRIVEGVNEALAGGKKTLAWRFAEKLAALRPLPPKVSPRGTFRFVAASASVVVTEAELRLEADFRPELALERRPAAPAPPREPPRAAPSPPGSPSSRSARV